MTWEHVTYVASDSDPCAEYEIKRRTSDGQVGCSCMAYRFSKGVKSCKHMQAFLCSVVNANRPTPASVVRRSLTVPATLGRIESSNGETFTFRRAISFDGNLSQR